MHSRTQVILDAAKAKNISAIQLYCDWAGDQNGKEFVAYAKISKKDAKQIVDELKANGIAYCAVAHNFGK